MLIFEVGEHIDAEFLQAVGIFPSLAIVGVDQHVSKLRRTFDQCRVCLSDGYEANFQFPLCPRRRGQLERGDRERGDRDVKCILADHRFIPPRNDDRAINLRLHILGVNRTCGAGCCQANQGVFGLSCCGATNLLLVLQMTLRTGWVG